MPKWSPTGSIHPVQDPVEKPEMGWILMIVMSVVVLGGLRTWRYSQNWGYGPARGFGVILTSVMVFLVMEYTSPYATSDRERILPGPGGLGTDFEPVSRAAPFPPVGEGMPPTPGKPPEDPIPPRALHSQAPPSTAAWSRSQLSNSAGIARDPTKGADTLNELKVTVD